MSSPFKSSLSSAATGQTDSDLSPDQVMMRRCIELARQALGKTAPNPLVGAVIVQDGEIVGEGFHPKAGQPHAEVFALRQAGDRARGATIYINLEPCNHFGRTPPCSEAIIAAGIKKAVVGMVDPDPRVSGGGIVRLQQAGIEVVVGVEAAACQELNEAFVYRVTHRRPFGILKYAMTLDGKIAATTGHSAWVTSSSSRSFVHQIRSACDAVVVGGNTVRQDNPLLTSRQERHTPLRVVMSKSLDLPTEANLWDTTIAPTLVVTEPGANPEFRVLLEKRNVEVLDLIPLTPAALMTHLYVRGLMSVLWECGGNLAAQAIADGSVQKVMAFIAPKIIGGSTAPSPIDDLGLSLMTDAIQLDRVTWRTIEADLLIEGYLPKTEKKLGNTDYQ